MKRGSALLIVLGVVSFMFVSAVGFAVYMRTSRMPSSYLRRNVTARHLVKAALAKAIGELEGDFNTDPNWGKTQDDSDTPTMFYGIYDDPFPGVLFGADDNERTTAEARQNGDFWIGRVFMPFGKVSEDKDGYGRKSLPTVSTLTLEALAYLPPAIIDDVRRLSRYTRTACWRQLPYGVGRYAYCAVNVSDLFDINRLRANVARNSGTNRVTLATLCMDDAGNIDSTLDEILNRAKTVGALDNPVPFVSLADFNLVAGAESNWAPFMNAIGYQDGNMLRDNVWQHENALFITDTWFPPKAAAGNEIALDLAAAQPFVRWDATSFMEIDGNGCLNPDTQVANQYFYTLGYYGLACLYDYLDSDSKPISLAIPTTEAVPMVVGIGSPKTLKPVAAKTPEPLITSVGSVSGDLEVTMPGNPPTTTTLAVNIQRTCTLVKIGSVFDSDPMVNVVVTCPLKRLAKENRTGSFKARALMRVWFASGGEPKNRIAGGNFGRPAAADFRDGRLGSVQVNNGVATLVCKQDAVVSFASDIKNVNDAVKNVQFEFKNLENLPLYYEVEDKVDPASFSSVPAGAGYAWKANASTDYGGALTDTNPLKWKAYFRSGDIPAASGSYNNRFLPFAYAASSRSLSLDPAWNNPASASAGNFNKSGLYSSSMAFSPNAGKCQICAAVWVQIRDGNGNVLDMAPASAKDDEYFLDADYAGEEDGGMAAPLGSGAPLLFFRSGTDIGYQTIEADLGAHPQGFSGGWNELYAVDPRFNFAPEDWFAGNSGDASADDWKNAVLSLLGNGGRDHDIFMFVSDQEYLQSIGELQFLPWLENLDVYNSSKIATPMRYRASLAGTSFSSCIGHDLSKLAHRDFFWKTHSAYPVGGDGLADGRNPYRMQGEGNKLVNFTSGNCFRVNPFSQDDRVLDAALIGTPFDWYVASTNGNQTQSGGRRNNLAGNISLSQMMSTYSFGESDVAKLSDDDLKKIAAEIKAAFADNAANGDRDWLAAWDDLMWQQNDNSHVNDNNKTFLDSGLTLSETLHGVDRKYLYSFWRECFDNRQQLFLIFVRAEPASVGGGGAGRVPSQMGGRAVALVWRDPEPPATASGTTRPTRSEFNNFQDFLTKRGSLSCPPHRTRVLFYHQFD